MSRDPQPDAPEPTEERPPLGSWRRMYTLVLVTLGGWILIFYLFTKAFA